MNPKIKFVLTLIIGAALITFFFWATQTIYKLTGHTITGATISIDQVSTEELAKCLTEKGAKMYGAYWCGHCQNQKTMFGNSFQHINYIECTTDGENANPQACQDAGIEGFPTWIINNKKYPGEQSLDKLKSLAGC